MVVLVACLNFSRHQLSLLPGRLVFGPLLHCASTTGGSAQLDADAILGAVNLTRRPACVSR